MKKLSPLWQRRLRLFKQNRRGYWSFIILAVLFAASLCAELIANDKPLLLHYNGSYYFPALTSYPETTFGGGLETEAIYGDPYVAKLITDKGGWMIWPPIRYYYDTIDFETTAPAPAPPSENHLLGTDDQGRDVLVRVIYGFRVSLIFGLLLTFLSSALGIWAGAIQGYFGGWIDLTFQRIIEILNSVPALVLIITIASIIEPSFFMLLWSMVFLLWVFLVDVVRAECLKTRNLDYVRAAKALGVKELTILFRHVLPNAFVAALTLIPIVLNISITSLTALDFLGFGLPPDSASLGELLRQGKDNIHATWLLLPSFIVLAGMMSMLVFIGEAARDALDPRKSLN